MVFLYVGLALLALAAVLYGSALMMFRYTFIGLHDHTREEARFYEHMEKGPLAADIPRMKEGKAALAATPCEELFITSFDGLKLRGRLYEQPGAKATAILCHGFKSFGEHDFYCIAPIYTRLGLNVLIIDQRAQNKSEGKYMTFGIFERFDVRDWAGLLLTRYGAAHKIALHGISMGCATVVMAAAMPDMPNLACLVADCGYATIRGQMHQSIRDMFHLPPWPLVNIAAGICRRKAGFSIDDASPLESAGLLRAPALFVHGDDDTFIRSDNSRAVQAACASKSELLIVPGAGHAQSCLVAPEEYEKRVTRLVKSSL